MAQVNLDGGGAGAGGTVVAPARTILLNPLASAGAIQQFALANTPGHTVVVQADGSLASAAGGGGGGYSTIKNNGSAVTQRTNLNLSAALTAADDAGNLETDLDLATGGVTTAKLADNVLSADATGRAKMADGFVTAAKLAVAPITAGGGAASGRVTYWTSGTQIDGEGDLTYDASTNSLTVGSLTSTVGADFNLKADDDLDAIIRLEVNSQATKPWLIAVDASDGHRLKFEHGSATPGGGTLTIALQTGSGDVEAYTDWNFKKSGTQTFSKEGTGSMVFRASLTGQEIQFKAKGTLECLTLTDDNTVGICKILPGGATYKFSVFNATAVAKQTVTGSRSGNAALASFLTAMANYGWVTDSSTA